MDSAYKLFQHSDRISLLRDGIIPIPVMVDIDPVDGVCNLDCEWCCQAASRASRPPRFMSVETMRELGRFCRGWGIKAWRISGDSEPTLNKQLDELIASGARYGLDMGLITNGVFLERLDQDALNRLSYLGVSLDAATPETWSRLKRSRPENFIKIIENVRDARRMAPSLDISLKFIRWEPEQSLSKQSFSQQELPLFNESAITDASNLADEAKLPELARSLGVKAIVKEAYKKDMASRYEFQACHATPLGGVFDASHKFHLCCDARNRFVLTDDYTRNNWSELPSLWGSAKHREMIASIEPKSCPGCAKFKMNEILEKMVISPAPDAQLNFI